MSGVVEVIAPATPSPTPTSVPGRPTPMPTPPQATAVPMLGAAGKLVLALGLAALSYFLLSRRS